MSKLPLKAYEDAEFLKGDACRAVRLELEFLKPEVTMDRHNIQSTIVLFGSARTLPPEVAAAALAKATEALDRAPGSAERQAAGARDRRRSRRATTTKSRGSSPPWSAGRRSRRRSATL